MKNLSFDDGRQSFTINGDPNRVIRFNPADPEIINRYLDLQKVYEGYQLPDDIELNPDGTPKSGMEKDGAYLTEFKNTMKRSFNDVFNADVYDKLFDGQSPLCIVGEEPQYLYMAVLECLRDAMEPAMKNYRDKNQELAKKMNKYLGDL